MWRARRGFAERHEVEEMREVKDVKEGRTSQERRHEKQRGSEVKNQEFPTLSAKGAERVGQPPDHVGSSERICGTERSKRDSSLRSE